MPDPEVVSHEELAQIDRALDKLCNYQKSRIISTITTTVKAHNLGIASAMVGTVSLTSADARIDYSVLENGVGNSELLSTDIRPLTANIELQKAALKSRPASVPAKVHTSDVKHQPIFVSTALSNSPENKGDSKITNEKCHSNFTAFSPAVLEAAIAASMGNSSSNENGKICSSSKETKTLGSDTIDDHEFCGAFSNHATKEAVPAAGLALSAESLKLLRAVELAGQLNPKEREQFLDLQDRFLLCQQKLQNREETIANLRRSLQAIIATAPASDSQSSNKSAVLRNTGGDLSPGLILRNGIIQDQLRLEEKREQEILALRSQIHQQQQAISVLTNTMQKAESSMQRTAAQHQAREIMWADRMRELEKEKHAQITTANANETLMSNMLSRITFLSNESKAFQDTISILRLDSKAATEKMKALNQSCEEEQAKATQLQEEHKRMTKQLEAMVASRAADAEALVSMRVSKLFFVNLRW